MSVDREAAVRALVRAGCVAPEAEADEVWRAAADPAHRRRMLERRIRGEPLAWIVGGTDFAGLRVRVDPGVYVPRPQTELLARRAAALLPPAGVALDLCTGAGAVALVLLRAHPDAVVIATDLDPVAVTCARANGVDARLGDLDGPVPPGFAARVDVLTAVVPYVPTEELGLLPRDVVAFEPRAALDGGPGGMRLLEEVARRSVAWLAPGGRLLMEVGGDQAEVLATTLREVGLSSWTVLRDAEGDVRAIEARAS